MTCKVCGNSQDNKAHIAREMLFGLQDEFTYIECSQCGCLQLAEIPPDMERYYPANYYSFTKPGSLRSYLKRQQSSYIHNKLNVIGAFLSYLYGPENAVLSVVRLDVSKDAKILDIGCGGGDLLLNLRRIGFNSLTGVDPYLPSETKINGIHLLKRELYDLDSDFDVVMLHHVFEHMADPASVLEHLSRILAPGGTVILRIPVSGCFAWRRYGVNWVSMDPPRHFFLHTEKSLAILTEAAGLRISETVYDSTLFQFIGSEQYSRNISLEDKRSYMKNPFRSIFSINDIRSFKQQARQLNQNRDGDSACFYLRKTH